MPDFLCYGPFPSMSLPPETWSRCCAPCPQAGDQSPELHPLAHLSHRPEQCPALEVFAVRVTVEREEVVPAKERVRSHLLHPEPHVAHLPVASLLRLDLGPNPYRHGPS